MCTPVAVVVALSADLVRIAAKDLHQNGLDHDLLSLPSLYLEGFSLALPAVPSGFELVKCAVARCLTETQFEAHGLFGWLIADSDVDSDSLGYADDGGVQEAKIVGPVMFENGVPTPPTSPLFPPILDERRGKCLPPNIKVSVKS